MSPPDSIRIRYAGLLAFAFCLAAPVTAAAQAPCVQWDASGNWWIKQSNDIDVHMDLRQDGSTITGTASSWRLEVGETILGIGQQGDDYVWLSNGSLDGTVQGDRFDVQIYWTTNGQIGVYSGEIGPRGRMEGTTHDRRKPSSRASWFSSIPLKCADAAASQPNRPAKALGKRKAIDKSLGMTGETTLPPVSLSRPKFRAPLLDGAAIVKPPCIPPKC
jgi:hypothetical protein